MTEKIAHTHNDWCREMLGNGKNTHTAKSNKNPNKIAPRQFRFIVHHKRFSILCIANDSDDSKYVHGTMNGVGL